ncbi:cytochrome PufQ [Ruegeria profundi]|uniref:Protein pufQ n=1 Tax=Ruegeria profundi TaxID=1685378 RepID=A0A0X3TVT0_9RHOB|nr:cytochrome PufQ [Ruegeria profundi]KUJ79798.1 protein pufQ [Ruegeria profundi]MCA0928501.1 protein pufQ [Ruegeria profundi]
MPAVTLNAHSEAGKKRSQRTPEFILYFSILFLISIPFAVVEWIRHALRRRTLNLRGPLARAWSEADRITPIIFSR